jgi:hypothetical protein
LSVRLHLHSFVRSSVHPVLSISVALKLPSINLWGSSKAALRGLYWGNTRAAASSEGRACNPHTTARSAGPVHGPDRRLAVRT